MEYVFINRHIDSLPMFCNWEIDEVIAFVGCFYGGILMTETLNAMIISITMGIVATYLYGKAKNASIKGFFSQLMYAWNLREVKTLIPSHKRYFCGA